MLKYLSDLRQTKSVSLSAHEIVNAALTAILAAFAMLARSLARRLRSGKSREMPKANLDFGQSSSLNPVASASASSRMLYLGESEQATSVNAALAGDWLGTGETSLLQV